MNMMNEKLETNSSASQICNLTYIMYLKKKDSSFIHTLFECSCTDRVKSFTCKITSLRDKWRKADGLVADCTRALLFAGVVCAGCLC